MRKTTPAAEGKESLAPHGAVPRARLLFKTQWGGGPAGTPPNPPKRGSVGPPRGEGGIRKGPKKGVKKISQKTQKIVWGLDQLRHMAEIVGDCNANEDPVRVAVRVGWCISGCGRKSRLQKKGEEVGFLEWFVSGRMFFRSHYVTKRIPGGT